MSSPRSSIFERLFGIAAGFFLAAMLIHIGVQLIESVWPALLALACLVALGFGAIAWFQGRRDSW